MARRDLGGGVVGRVLVPVVQLAADGGSDKGEGLGEGECAGAGQFVDLARVAVVGEGSHRDVCDVLHVDEGFTALPGRSRELTIQNRRKEEIRPGSRVLVLVDGADRCTLVGALWKSGRNWRVTGRTVGDAANSSTDLLVTAGYRGGGDLCQPLLDALPPVTIVRPDSGLHELLSLIAAEIEKEEPGQQSVLDRFLDLLLVRVLRTWFAHPGATPPPGYRALADPDIGHVLRRLHEEPARPWTVASLAAEAGMSRTAFARRFSALVGRPPLAYLTDWRMALAADRLRVPGVTVAEVGSEVGYTDGFSFSAAFKRVRGIPPSAHRDRS
ncbi:AraC family transcriptional regulator [Streptomyces sp. NPDC004783]|uniref:AraC family transcriptional regulator n=1 Tax=Streptomyces sp. NPDC004783 TaxID=3154459 RepID=UPI0033A29C4C